MSKTKIKKTRRIFSITLVLMLACSLCVPAGLAYAGDAEEVGVLEDTYVFMANGQTDAVNITLGNVLPEAAIAVESSFTSQGETYASSWQINADTLPGWLMCDPQFGGPVNPEDLITTLFVSLNQDNLPSEITTGQIVLSQYRSGATEDTKIIINVTYANIFEATPFGTLDHAKGGTVTTTIDGEYDNFSAFSRLDANGMPVGDPLILSKDFNKVAGSTVITLTEQYLKALPVGQYSFAAFYTDGASVPITLTVVDTRSNPVTPTTPTTPTTPSSALPRTGDTVSGLLGLSLFVAFAAAGGVFMLRRRMAKTDL